MSAERVLSERELNRAWDATLRVHALRTGVMLEEYRKKIFHVGKPHSLRFLVDARPVGPWERAAGSSRPTDRVACDAPVAARWRDEKAASSCAVGRAGRGRARRSLADEADRLAAFHALNAAGPSCCSCTRNHLEWGT